MNAPQRDIHFRRRVARFRLKRQIRVGRVEQALMAAILIASWANLLAILT